MSVEVVDQGAVLVLLYVAGGEAEAQVAQGHWQDRQGEKRGQVGGVGEEVVLSGEGGCAG